MVEKKIKQKIDERKLYLLMGTAFVVGVVVGRKMQYKIDAKVVQKALKNAAVFTKSAKPMFPETMPISEIKEVLSKMEGTEVLDAVVATVNGVQTLIIR